LAKAADILRRDAMMQFYLGFAYLDAGDDHRSVIAFDRAIALDKGHAEFYYYKGFALERRLDLAGALANYQAAVIREPGTAGYVASVARISAQLAAGGHDGADERASSSDQTSLDSLPDPLLRRGGRWPVVSTVVATFVA